MCGAPISWSAKKLRQATSTCEAEYTAASNTVKDVDFIRNIMSEMDHELYGYLILAVDNKAAVDVAHNMGTTALTKHYDLIVHSLRQSFLAGRTKPVLVSTFAQRADIMTKALDKTTYLHIRKWLLH